MIGRTVLHYKIMKKLGEGGMGVVYLAEDTKLKRQVAIKFLPHNISTNEEERKRFEIEAQAAAALNHPNISTIYAIEESGEDTFIVMEFIDGIELKNKIKTGPVSIKEATNIAIQIAEGLEAAHKKGIIHRDIKSSNIMITDDGKVKIMDFGLAKFRGASKLTQIGTTVGTISYMSPEQARGEEVDQRTDTWSLGVVLYEMLIGKMPFMGDFDQAIIYLILNEEPKFVNEFNQGFKRIIKKSLAKKPKERYQTAGEIAEDLRTISQGGEVKITRIKGGEATTLEIKTIAILPFDDLSPKKDHGYFSDGLSEELINNLSRNPKLRVSAKTSSFYFRGKDVDLKTIAAKLNVKYILEGSVRKSGNNLRISANLVNIETEATLWTNTYNGTLNNIFALQDSISDNVSEALDVALLGKQSAMNEKQIASEAYKDYLLGKHFYTLGGKKNWKKAEKYFENVLSIDSNYAPAWLSLSLVHTAQVNIGFVAFDVGYDKANEELKKALQINPNLADAYVQKAVIKIFYEWDWLGADESLQQDLNLRPRNERALSIAAWLANVLGKHDEAITLQHRSINIDPVRSINYFSLAFFTRNAGLTDKSIAASRKCLELNPQFAGAHWIISLNYIEKGKPDSAMSEIGKETEPWMKKSVFPIVFYALGRKKEADDKLADYIKEYHNVAAFHIAENYAYRNEKDKAFEWLERAYNRRDVACIGIKGDPLLGNIVNDARYAAFLKKMELPL